MPRPPQATEPDTHDRRGAATARVLLAIACAAAVAWLAWRLGHVDGALDPAAGPDRLVAAIGADTTPAQVRADAARALRDRPIDGRAYRVLAQLADAGLEAAGMEEGGDPARAGMLYAIAAERWPRDRIARAMLADRALAAGDADTALVHIDALLRVAPGTRQPVLSQLVLQLAVPRLRASLLRRLAHDPPWRNALARALQAEATPLQPALQLLSALAAQQPLTPAELDARIALLERDGRPAEARQAWLQALGPEQRSAAGHVYDGGFEYPQVEGGYGWHVAAPPGVAIGPDPTDPAAGAYALAIAFDGRGVRFAHLRQPLALPPGRYRLQAASDNRVDSTRAFVWTVECDVGQVRSRLLDMPLPMAPGWQRTAAEFTVPEGCPKQLLYLHHTARTLAERTIRGRLQVDGIAVRAMPATDREKTLPR